jgi:hypothetical protein
MQCILELFLCCFKSPTILHSSVNSTKWTAAGSFFTDGFSVLAGVQPHKTEATISGIGGGANAGETYIETAIRETLEELFDFDIIPRWLLRRVERSLTPSIVFQNDLYIYLVYSFKDLEQLLRIVKESKIRSRLYSTIPLTVSDLILQRSQSISAEVQRLVLIPISNTNQDTGIHSDLLKDITLYNSVYGLK